MDSLKRNKNKRAFTLIELLVVMAIIALLASIVLIALNNARMKARDAKRVADLDQLHTALAMYYGDNGQYPNCGRWSRSYDVTWTTTGCLQTALAPYLAKLPTDPTNSTTGGGPWLGAYAYAYGSSSPYQDYDLVGAVEDVNNPDRCQVKNWVYHSDSNDWCHTDGYSMYLIADH